MGGGSVPSSRRTRVVEGGRDAQARKQVERRYRKEQYESRPNKDARDEHEPSETTNRDV